MFFIIEKSEETTFEFSQNAVTVVWFWLRIKMETQKIVNLLGDADNESSKFATRKWYVINDQNNTDNCQPLKMVQPLNLNPKSLNQVFVLFRCIYSCNEEYNSNRSWC